MTLLLVLFNRHPWFNCPQPTFAISLFFGESRVLAQIVSYTTLPPVCGHFYLEIGMLPLNSSIDLRK